MINAFWLYAYSAEEYFEILKNFSKKPKSRLVLAVQEAFGFAVKEIRQANYRGLKGVKLKNPHYLSLYLPENSPVYEKRLKDLFLIFENDLEKIKF